MVYRNELAITYMRDYLIMNTSYHSHEDKDVQIMFVNIVIQN